MQNPLCNASKITVSEETPETNVITKLNTTTSYSVERYVQVLFGWFRTRRSCVFMTTSTRPLLIIILQKVPVREASDIVLVYCFYSCPKICGTNQIYNSPYDRDVN